LFIACEIFVFATNLPIRSLAAIALVAVVFHVHQEFPTGGQNQTRHHEIDDDARAASAGLSKQVAPPPGVASDVGSQPCCYAANEATTGDDGLDQ